eukprot:6130708-Pleurochrysis_carterae.AAC.1
MHKLTSGSACFVLSLPAWPTLELLWSIRNAFKWHAKFTLGGTESISTHLAVKEPAHVAHLLVVSASC